MPLLMDFHDFVTGIRVVDNIAHGIPHRVRSDHGTENLEVAAWMEERFGVECGLYI